MGYMINFLVFGGVFLLTLADTTSAKAGVDVWNEDGATYRVVVHENSGQTVYTLSSGQFRKGICENCVVAISPLSGDSWSDQIEASGQDVIELSLPHLALHLALVGIVARWGFFCISNLYFSFCHRPRRFHVI